jgi:hypothetical protein
MVVSPSYQYPPPTNLLQSLTSMQRAGRRISLCCLCTRSKKQDVRSEQLQRCREATSISRSDCANVRNLFQIGMGNSLSFTDLHFRKA